MRPGYNGGGRFGGVVGGAKVGSALAAGGPAWEATSGSG